MKDAVIVYVTRTGHSRILATELGAMLGAPVHEIIDLTNRKGALRFMLGGSQAVRKVGSPIQDPNVSLKGIRKVIMVQPVWASNLCPPLRSWLHAHHDELGGVSLSLAASNLGSAPEKFRANVEKEFGPLAAFCSIAESLTAESKKEILKNFAEAVKG